MTVTITLRFHGDLNDLLRDRSWRESEIERSYPESPAAIHPIEAAGVPHTEVGLLLLNGEPASFSQKLADGDRLELYPFSHQRRFASAAFRPNAPEGEKRFVVDVHLGRLARNLRMLGFNSLYRNDYSDAQIARLANEEKRIALSCNRELLKRKEVVYGQLIRSNKIDEQVSEVLERFQMRNFAPLTICINCNGRIAPVAKERVIERLEPLTKKYYDKFFICEKCEQIYWQGSHCNRISLQIEKFTGQAFRD